MWKCSKCETENDGKFCKVCGSEQTKQSYATDKWNQLPTKANIFTKNPVADLQNGKPTNGSFNDAKLKSSETLLAESSMYKKRITRNKLLIISSLVAILILMTVPYTSFYTGRLTSQGYEIWDVVSIFSLMLGYDVTFGEIVGSWMYFILALLPTIFVFAKRRNPQKNTPITIAFICAVFMTGFNVAIWIGNTSFVPFLSLLFIWCSVIGTVRTVRLTKKLLGLAPYPTALNQG